MSPPHLLVASHTYSAPINHAKLRALAALGPLTVIAPRRWSDSLFTIAPEVASRDYAFHALPTWFAGRILRYVYHPLALRRLLAAARPELVYVEAEPASLALAQFSALKRWGRYRLACFTWENINRRVGLPSLEHYNLAHCDGVITGNQAAAQVIAAKGFHGPLTVTPQLGVDPEHFHPAEEAATPISGQLVAGYMGRFVEEKGLETFWRAACDAPGVQLLWVGGGPLTPNIEQWRREQPDRLQIIDAVPHERAADYLRQMDVLVLPSHTTPTWKEQFGHVLIEAMACGVPVIGSDSGAIPEVIAAAGLVVPERNVEALRSALLRLRDDAALRAHLGRAGRERVLAHYTHARIAAANIAFFEQLLAA